MPEKPGNGHYAADQRQWTELGLDEGVHQHRSRGLDGYVRQP